MSTDSRTGSDLYKLVLQTNNGGDVGSALFTGTTDAAGYKTLVGDVKSTKNVISLDYLLNIPSDVLGRLLEKNEISARGMSDIFKLRKYLLEMERPQLLERKFKKTPAISDSFKALKVNGDIIQFMKDVKNIQMCEDLSRLELSKYLKSIFTDNLGVRFQEHLLEFLDEKSNIFQIIGKVLDKKDFRTSAMSKLLRIHKSNETVKEFYEDFELIIQMLNLNKELYMEPNFRGKGYWWSKLVRRSRVE